jgi:hypothetical protein
VRAALDRGAVDRTHRRRLHHICTGTGPTSCAGVSMQVFDCGPRHRCLHLPRCSLGAVTLETMPTIAELKTILTRAKSRGIFCSFDPNLRSTARLLHWNCQPALGPNPAASALGLYAQLYPHPHRELGSPLPHLHRDWAHPCSISSPGLGPPLPHLRRDWARPCHICTGTGLGPALLTRTLAHARTLRTRASEPAVRVLYGYRGVL